MNRTVKLILVAGLLSAGAFAGGKALSERVDSPVPHCSLDCLSARLQLTPEQRRLCASSDRGFDQRRSKLVKTLTERRVKLMDLLRDPDPSRERIDEALEAVAEAQAALQRAVVDHLLRLKAFLTPEQQHELFESLGQHMCGGMGLGMGPGAEPSDKCDLHKRGTGDSH